MTQSTDESGWTAGGPTTEPAAEESALQSAGSAVVDVVDRLQNDAELTGERGTTTIAPEVVKKVAGIAAREVAGVHDLGGDVARAFASVRERFGLGESGADTDRGVSVRLDGTSAEVKVVLVVEYGHPVHEVGEQVRAGVIAAVEKMLSLTVATVDIVIDDVHTPESPPAQP